jgi:hypothetical protein
MKDLEVGLGLAVPDKIKISTPSEDSASFKKVEKFKTEGTNAMERKGIFSLYISN